MWMGWAGYTRSLIVGSMKATSNSAPFFPTCISFWERNRTSTLVMLASFAPLWGFKMPSTGVIVNTSAYFLGVRSWYCTSYRPLLSSLRVSFFSSPTRTVLKSMSLVHSSTTSKASHLSCRGRLSVATLPSESETSSLRGKLKMFARSARKPTLMLCSTFGSMTSDIFSILYSVGSFSAPVMRQWIGRYDTFFIRITFSSLRRISRRPKSSVHSFASFTVTSGFEPMQLTSKRTGSGLSFTSITRALRISPTRSGTAISVTSWDSPGASLRVSGDTWNVFSLSCACSNMMDTSAGKRPELVTLSLSVFAGGASAGFRSFTISNGPNSYVLRFVT
eukprot:PhM_4_TR5537/c0_g1_i1/m.106425